MLREDARLEDLPFADGEKAEPIVLSIAARLKRVGIEMKMVVDAAAVENERARINPALIKLLVKAHLVKERLIGAGDASLTEIARDEGVSRPYLSCLVRLAFLAPDITAAILAGCQPQELTAKQLMNVARLPADWGHQRAALGFS